MITLVGEWLTRSCVADVQMHAAKAEFRTVRANPMAGRPRLKFYFSAFTQESFKVTVRLNTGAPTFESTRSATK